MKFHIDNFLIVVFFHYIADHQGRTQLVKKKKETLLEIRISFLEYATGIVGVKPSCKRYCLNLVSFFYCVFV